MISEHLSQGIPVTAYLIAKALKKHDSTFGKIAFMIPMSSYLIKLVSIKLY